MSDLKNVIYNCQQATYLMEKKLMDKITMRESIELRLHLVGCRMCRRYLTQSKLITEAVIEMLKHQQELKLDITFKSALQVRIENYLNKN